MGARDTDTIAAVATAAGPAGVGIVRLSGPRAAEIARAMAGPLPAPRRAAVRAFRDAHGRVLDTGLVLYFPAPHSFTGEEVVELHGHGAPVVLDLVLRRALQLGARMARPGEFSERAFLNDKIDLVQAEAIADLIASTTEQAARAAVQSLQGAFSAQVQVLIDQLIELRMYVESAIDFPEEEIDFLSSDAVGGRLAGVQDQLQRVLAASRQGALLREGMRVVIAGRPNAGKSSLLNRLAGSEVAIVTDVPGTTRDLLRETIAIDGLPVHVIDTAGLRTARDPVEQEGVRRAWSAIEQADRVLLVVDDTLGWGGAEDDILGNLPAGLARTIVCNKIDLSGTAPGVHDGPHGPQIAVSARTGAGIDVLRTHLKACMGYRSEGEGAFIARRRHLDALEQAAGALERARTQLVEQRAGELLAEELRAAQQALEAITGAFTPDDLLDRIFRSFCIGK